MLLWELMSAQLTLRNVFWAATSLGEIVLICYLIHRKLARSHFWLFFYLCCTVAQSALGVVTYSLFDFRSAATRNITIGFSLYSCFYVINDSLLEKWMEPYIGFWGFMDVITFLACLFIWIQAVRVYAPAREFLNPESVPSDLYGALSPEVNVRLRLLNDQLAQLIRSESPRL
jgi:hypothetical protein